MVVALEIMEEKHQRLPCEGELAREARLIEEFLNCRPWPGVLGAKPRRILHPALLEGL